MRLVLLRESTNLNSIVNKGKATFDNISPEEAIKNGVAYLKPTLMEITDAEKMDQYVDLCVQTTVQYEQVWVENLFKVLDDCGIDFNIW